MTDMRARIAGMAEQAAREGALSLMAHANRSQDGKARLSVTIDAARIDSGAFEFSTRWQAQHTDKDSDEMPAQVIDPRQEEMGI